MQAPAHWPAVDTRLITAARERVRIVLADQARTARELAMYYDPDGDYAGPIFDDRAHVATDEFTPADLLAITAMQVQASPRALGRFLKRDAHRRQLRDALVAAPDAPLWEAPAVLLDAAADLYALVKRQFSDGNMWVTASKLCARKRPQLIPVRDSVLVADLGLPNRDYRSDWLIMGAVMDDPDIRTGLRQCAEAADPDGRTILTGVPDLRLLDAALWMRWSRGGRARDAVERQAAGTCA